MRIAFYAPLKAPSHPVPSGDRRVARLYWQALEQAGHAVELASTLRSYEREGDAQAQGRIRVQAEQEAAALIARWSGPDAAQRPSAWFSYHPYYKAPDWIGPAVAGALSIPYVMAETSCAAKRAQGPWAAAHAQTVSAIRQAALLICPTAHDLPGVRAVAGPQARVVQLAPFLDASPYAAAAERRAASRTALAAQHGADATQPWLLAVGMMRAGDKLASYQALAQALAGLGDRAWQLFVAGDGVAREAVAASLRAAAGARVHLLGACEPDALLDVYAACDLCVWPAVNEAYGMAMLEAQACGLPVVSCAERGVAEVVADGIGGLLAPAGDMPAFAQRIRALLDDPARRMALGRAARERVLACHDLAPAARTLDAWLRALPGPRGAA